jgi:mannose-6-phosphate isomerase-like protein (cupin superfamily)
MALGKNSDSYGVILVLITFYPFPMSYQSNILMATAGNDFFRQVLFTGARSQLVVMSLNPGEEIGAEVHAHVEQLLFFMSGTGKVILDDKETQFAPGDVVIVTPGTKHNFINDGLEKVKIYTVYAPANHIEAVIHKTKQDAVNDIADEAFGEAIV